MPDDSALAELFEIATSTVPLPQRAQGLVERLETWLPVDGTWLALPDPDADVYATIGSTGLDRSVLDYLDRPAVAREIQLNELNHTQPPVSLSELPVAAGELPTWAECLVPAGFDDGIGVPLFEPGGPYLGLLTLLFAGGEPPSVALRDRIARLAPLIARGVSPMRSLLVSARLVQGATAGAVLLRDGTLCPLPGLEDHALLVGGSPVVTVARARLLTGQVYGSFLWPGPDGHGPTAHLRVTMVAATGLPDFVLGMVLVTPDADCHGLTTRELQVLGLLVDGRSNQQIAKSLGVATRTVATHVEHLLEKLDAPSRTLAAVLAEREGCYVPPPPDAFLASRH